MEKIVENLYRIKEKVAAAQAVSGYNEEIELIAASKNQPPESLLMLASEGSVTVFGENKVQEYMTKKDTGLTFDIIGRLQTNKVKYVVGNVRLIQSVDRFELLQEIEKKAEKRGIIQSVLMEVNSGGEENKGGVLPENIRSFAELFLDCPHVKLEGIMAVAPIADENTLRRLFENVREKFELLKTDLSGIKYLSMGMSEDYETAIKCGSNMVRLGRALFGENSRSIIK